MSDPFSSFGKLENELWSSMAESADFTFTNDARAMALYHEAYFNPGAWDSSSVQAIRDELHNYMMDQYGYDFEAEFDWDAWREAYENN
jgi:hypothetical protein